MFKIIPINSNKHNLLNLKHFGLVEKATLSPYVWFWLSLKLGNVNYFEIPLSIEIPQKYLSAHNCR